MHLWSGFEEKLTPQMKILDLQPRVPRAVSRSDENAIGRLEAGKAGHDLGLFSIPVSFHEELSTIQLGIVP